MGASLGFYSFESNRVEAGRVTESCGAVGEGLLAEDGAGAGFGGVVEALGGAEEWR